MKRIATTTMTGLVLLALPVLSGMSLGAFAQEQKYAGTELHIGSVANGPTKIMTGFLDEFTAETGIIVTVEAMGNRDLFKKITLESIGETGYFDLMRISPNYIPSFVEPGWLVPLDEFVERDGYDLADFIPSGLQMLGRRPGDDTLWAIPKNASSGMLTYRTDLFGDPNEKAAFEQKYGYELNPPETFQQWLDTAEFFTRDTDGDGEMDLYGFGSSQQAPNAAAAWAMVLIWSMGGDILNEDETKVALNSPESVAGFEWGLKMQKFQPKGVLAWATQDIKNMADGRMAMSMQLLPHARKLLKPETSRFHDRFAFTTVPVAENNTRGYTTGKYLYGGGGFAMHAHSDNKEGAWEFMKWMFNKEQAMRFAEAGTLFPRYSVLQSEEVLEAFPEYKKIIPVFRKTLEHVVKGRPQIAESSALVRVLGDAWQEAALGQKTPAEAIAAADQRMKDILREAGYPNP